jgi:hypothetical protein
LPQPIVLLILFRGADPKFGTLIPSPENPKPIHTDRLSFFSLCLDALCWRLPCLLSGQYAEVEDIPNDLHWPSPLLRHDIFDAGWTGFSGIHSLTGTMHISVGRSVASCGLQWPWQIWQVLRRHTRPWCSRSRSVPRQIRY